MKGGTSNTTNTPEDSSTNTNVAPDAMTWASTWEMMNRTLEAFTTRNTDSSERGSGKSRKDFKKPKELKDDSDGCIDTWVEGMRLHLEQDNDERQACIFLPSEYGYFFRFVNMNYLDFCFISSGVGALSFESV